jgi:hypothetical protein
MLKLSMPNKAYSKTNASLEATKMQDTACHMALSSMSCIFLACTEESILPQNNAPISLTLSEWLGQRMAQSKVLILKAGAHLLCTCVAQVTHQRHAGVNTDETIPPAAHTYVWPRVCCCCWPVLSFPTRPSLLKFWFAAEPRIWSMP